MKIMHVTAIAAMTLLTFSGVASAAEKTNVVEAEKIIEEYKELRADCAKTEGDARKFCFAKLNDANKRYVAAKQYLRQSNSEAEEGKDLAAHQVTFL